jgi:tetratricopeptide (TPR) repeat protein
LIPPREYLELLDRREPEVLARGEIITHADTVATVWSTSMDHLRKSDSAAVDLLIFCGYLAAEPIPLDLFTQHAALLPPPLDTILADPLAAAEAVGALADYSLLRRTDRGLVIHRLVQAVSRQSGLTGSRQPPLAVVLRLLVADLPTKLASPDSWPRWRQMLGHVLAACGHHDDHAPVAADETARLLDSAARYQRIHGDAQASRNLLERVLRIVEGMPDPHPRRVAHALGRLGWTLCGVGEPATARLLLERALALYEAALEPGHPALINAMDNLGWALRELDDPAARPLIERTLSAYETACAAGQPENEQHLYNLGNAFMHLGDLGTARRLYERALLLAERTGPYGPQLRLSILHNLALLLARVDKPKKARRLCVQALALAESVYGPDHPELITLLVRLADLTGGAASESADDYLYRALVLIEQHYGTDHPDHLWIKNHLNRDRN